MAPATPLANDEPGDQPTVVEAYKTKLGTMYQGFIEDFLEVQGKRYKGKAQLVFFSPPFPLNRKKAYGNLTGDAYLEWLTDLAPRLSALLKPSGSLVMELGNAWESGRPVMSLLPLKALMAVAEGGKLNVCQQFICHNPARLPSPAQWVTIERIRVKDMLDRGINTVWSVGGQPRHPSRGHQFLSDKYGRTAGGTFEKRLSTVLVQSPDLTLRSFVGSHPTR